MNPNRLSRYHAPVEAPELHSVPLRPFDIEQAQSSDALEGTSVRLRPVMSSDKRNEECLC
jgi:hypothetical protein